MKGRTLHIVGPDDDYNDEEDPTMDEDVDPEFDEMAVPEDVINKRASIEASKEEVGQVKNFRLTKHLKQMI